MQHKNLGKPKTVSSAYFKAPIMTITPDSIPRPSHGMQKGHGSHLRIWISLSFFTLGNNLWCRHFLTKDHDTQTLFQAVNHFSCTHKCVRVLLSPLHCFWVLKSLFFLCLKVNCCFYLHAQPTSSPPASPSSLRPFLSPSILHKSARQTGGMRLHVFVVSQAVFISNGYTRGC